MKQFNDSKIAAALLAALTLTLASTSSRAELVPTYIGIDGRATLASGAYTGLPNPNFGRLTFLHAHGFEQTFANNHYHGIGAYSYTGPADSPAVTNTSSGNRIPEVYTALPPLTLVAAPTNDLAFTGRLMSQRTEEHYSDMRLRPARELSRYPTNSSEWAMFISSAGTRTNSLAGIAVALELVSKTDGLSVGKAGTVNALNNAGNRLPLGEGDDWEALPLFSVDGNAAPGVYTASLKLVDLNAANPSTNQSGLFHLDFRVPPPPALEIADAVRIDLPLVTDGYALQYAAASEGPWTTYTNLQHTVETIGSGEGAQQTFKRYYSIKRTPAMQFFRLQKP